MPLGTREVLLIMSAQDRASSVLQTIGKNFNTLDSDATEAAKKQMATGAALMAVGAGISAVGVSGLAVYASMGQAALEYNNQAVLTMTQTQGLGISLEQIKNTARDVAKEIPVPLEQLQGSLYDIFSSMDVSLSQSKTLLEAFAKGAVAGQVEIQKSSQATIGLMNAFKVPVENVNKVMDLQFQLVATGVGTYDQFASVLGLVSPSAVRAGQSMESMAGMMAFLTRNGLSTSAAAAAAGRALDSIANPKTIAHFKEMGMTVTDANGQFKPMTDIVQQMADKFKNLNPEQRSAALKELFLSSGGTIQAMRFWNTAVENVPALKDYTQEMYNAGGAMDSAFGMFEEHDPGFQMQLLKNNLDVLRTEVGDKFIPVLGKLSGWMIKVVQWFDNLNPAVKNTILIVGLVVPILITILGVVVVAVGAFMALSAAAVFLGTTVGTLVAIVAGVVAAIVALAVAGVMIYKNWEPLSKFIDGIADKFKNWRDWVTTAITTVQAAWFAFQRGFENPGGGINSGLGLLITVFYTLGQVVAIVVAGAKLAWEGLVAVWTTLVMPALTTLSSVFMSIFAIIAAVVTAFWILVQPIFDVFWTYINTILIPVLGVLLTIGLAVFNGIADAVSWWWDKILSPIFGFVIDIITGVLIPAFQLWWNIVTVIFAAVGAVIQVFWAIFSTIMQMIIGLIVAALKPAFESFASTAKTAMNAIATVVEWAWDNVIKPIWGAIVDYWNTTLKPVIEAIGTVWGTVFGALGSVADAAFSAAKAVIVAGINGIIGNLNSLMSSAVSVVNTLVDAYNSVPGAPSVNKITAPKIPTLHTGGFVNGAAALRNDEVLRILQVGEGVINKRAMASLGTTGLANLNAGRGTGGNLVIGEGAIVIHINGADPASVQQQVQDGVTSALQAFYRELRAS